MQDGRGAEENMNGAQGGKDASEERQEFIRGPQEERMLLSEERQEPIRGPQEERTRLSQERQESPGGKDTSI